MVQSNDSSDFACVCTELKKWSLLLESDAALPSVAGLIAGSPIHGSWWSHPKGRAIFRATRELADHPNVLLAKLVSGKLTYLHRRIWPAFLAAAMAKRPWQLPGLTKHARALLSQVSEAGVIRSDLIRVPHVAARAIAATVRLLEQRLLIHTEELHTESGAHAKFLETWKHWKKRVGFVGRKMTPEAGQQKLTRIVHELNDLYHGHGWLPWEDSKPRSAEMKQRRRRSASEAREKRT